MLVLRLTLKNLKVKSKKSKIKSQESSQRKWTQPKKWRRTQKWRRPQNVADLINKQNLIGVPQLLSEYRASLWQLLRIRLFKYYLLMISCFQNLFKMNQFLKYFFRYIILSILFISYSMLWGEESSIYVIHLHFKQQNTTRQSRDTRARAL